MLQKKIGQFLKQHADFSRPVILALSGGPDSLALLQMLLACELPLNLHVAHVDHRWRPESSQEAAALESLAQRLRLPFHLKVLDPASLKGNLEAASRDQRLIFFRELCNTLNAQAVLLAHHANDQAETVLNRVLEGRFLSSLRGIEEVTCVNGVQLWRPLLSFSKEEISATFKNQEPLLTPVADPTNFDPRFLRGRMRTEILPTLSRSFGKEILGSLCRLGEEVASLNDFLSEVIEDYLQGVVTGPFGTLLDLSAKPLPHPFLLQHLVRCFCEEYGLCLSYHQVGIICEWIAGGVSDSSIVNRGKVIYIDRKRLFLIEEEVEKVDWQVQMHPFSGDVTRCSWLDFWKGKALCTLPAGEYEIALAPLNMPYPGQTAVRKWWSDHKIPAFFRPLVPVVWSKGCIVHEFLTGRVELKGAHAVEISIFSD